MGLLRQDSGSHREEEGIQSEFPSKTNHGTLHVSKRQIIPLYSENSVLLCSEKSLPKLEVSVQDRP